MSIWRLEDLCCHDVPMACIDGKWVPARPINYRYRILKERLKEAYAVFTGRADAFTWPMGQ